MDLCWGDGLCVYVVKIHVKYIGNMLPRNTEHRLYGSLVRNLHPIPSSICEHNQSGDTASIQPGFCLRRQDLRVSVNTWHETKSDCSADSLCNLPLVNWAQTGLTGVLDTAHGRHIFGHDGKIL